MDFAGSTHRTNFMDRRTGCLGHAVGWMMRPTAKVISHFTVISFVSVAVLFSEAEAERESANTDLEVIMISEVFNANPTIYAKSKRSLRKSRFETGQSLWVDVDVPQDQWSDTSDVEPIDQDEIFGENVKICTCVRDIQ